MAGYELVVVGTSWGGLQALRTMVAGLPPTFAIPLVLVQHRHLESDSLLARLLQERTPLAVCEAEDKMPIERGRVYIAPADYHLLVDEGYFSLSTEAPVRYSRPSIDVTFTSASDAYAAQVVGVVLTGANSDGAEGLRRIVDQGGLGIVQEPSTAESATMPAAALRRVPTALVRRVDEIAAVLAALPAHAAPAPSAAADRERARRA